MINLEEIENQFIEVIKYSQQVDPKNYKEVISQWYNSKSYYISKFGDKLIYESPNIITVNLSEEEKLARFNEFICWISDEYDEEDLFVFLNKNGYQCFFDNKVEIPDEGRGIPKGMKLLKSFKFFEPNREILADLQNKASMIIQEDKLSGRLCLSVHPLDYLSLSETTYNWRSCHALDGDYRAGNISYMLDQTTVVCYLKGVDNVKLPRFPESVPWNSKKWRALLYFGDNKSMIFAGKGYPFVSQDLLDEAMELVIETELMAKVTAPSMWDVCKLSNWSNKYIDTFDGFDLDDKYLMNSNFELIKISDIMQDAYGSCQYNDVIRSHSYSPYYSRLVHSFREPFFETRIIVGAATKCLGCGDQIIESGDGTMFCPDCESKYHVDGPEFKSCDICWTIMDVDDMYKVGCEYLCPSCYEKYTAPCEDCGERHFKKDMTMFRIDHDNSITWVCSDCLFRRENS